uniref:Mobilization protein n=1 Tax=Strongyloides venezuelensis TaxID=75913 RepID=A0A0K0FZP0_STRVS
MASNAKKEQNLKAQYIDGSMKLTLSRSKRVDAYNTLSEKQNFLYKELPGELADAVIDQITKEHELKMSMRFNKKLQEEQEHLSKGIETLQNEKRTFENNVEESNKRITSLAGTLGGINEGIKKLEEQNTKITEELRNKVQIAMNILQPQNPKIIM